MAGPLVPVATAAGCHVGESTLWPLFPLPPPKPQSFTEHLQASESQQRSSERPHGSTGEKVLTSKDLSKKGDSPRKRRRRRRRQALEGPFLLSFSKSQHHFLVPLGPRPPQPPVLTPCSVRALSAPGTAPAILGTTLTLGRWTSRPRATHSADLSIWSYPTVRSWEGPLSLPKALPQPRPCGKVLQKTSHQ